jgi:16S rRNA (cytosine967-C5)-methyltransferase
MNAPAALCLRCARRDELVAQLGSAGVEAAPTPRAPAGVLVRRGSLATVARAARGIDFQVQDEAAQLVSLYAAGHLLGTGARVLDACAAPGGKTFHLAELLGPRGEVVAVDVHPRKAEELRGDAVRRGLARQVRVVCADATRPLPGLAPASFDAVLVDAPCTGLGTLRRHPELKLRRAASDPTRMAETQRAILAACAPYAKPGAVVTYSVCSLTRAEGPAVAEWALEHGLERARAPRELAPDLFTAEGDLLTLPHRHGCDGFFAARFVPRGSRNAADGAVLG